MPARYRKLPTIKLPAILCPTYPAGRTFDETMSNMRAHNSLWSCLEKAGIQPCGLGVQVYAQPEGSKAIAALGRLLLNVALRVRRTEK